MRWAVLGLVGGWCAWTPDLKRLEHLQEELHLAAEQEQAQPRQP